mmetsp:Transcript_32237/g.99729  ORF Transcript_32237/g.99729 Transcript_32237/m.99729 type:complete len:204 (+) Transcript_32237:466-1077(+)
MRVHEFAERRVEREALDALALEAEHELRRGAVHAVARGDDVGADAEHVRDGAQLAGRLLLVDREDRARRDVAVDVRRAVEGVEADAEAARPVLGADDGLLVFLRDEDAARPALDERVDEDVVRQHVELLLVVARRVLVARHAEEVRDARLGARARRRLAGQRHLRHQDRQLLVLERRHEVLGERVELGVHDVVDVFARVQRHY